MRELPESVPGIADVRSFSSGGAATGRTAELLIEIPHGATSAQHFAALESRLHRDYPDDLREFFFVNTDVGAPEVAEEIARRVVDQAAIPVRVVLVRGLLPRTFVDVNRVLGELPPDYSRTGLTPGMPDYVTDPGDQAVLRELHETYQAIARTAYDAVCGRGGLALMLHSYAPRSIDVGRIDSGVVAALRRAYEPEQYERWPRRPEVEVIDRTPDGECLAPVRLVEALDQAYTGEGFTFARSTTYLLDPSTSGWVHSMRYRGQTLCMEINRALVADPFDPFREMRIAPAKAARVAAPAARIFAAALANPD